MEEIITVLYAVGVVLSKFKAKATNLPNVPYLVMDKYLKSGWMMSSTLPAMKVPVDSVSPILLSLIAFPCLAEPKPI